MFAIFMNTESVGFLYLILKYYLHWCTLHNLANFV